ncbi:MAG TPA: sigma-70 family RNA polymerase sigma factor [Candidatus Binatia bacterium]|nr:sigma-70 family RNA polymerase sigma factor [Candidatus Binatia bacterium]
MLQDNLKRKSSNRSQTLSPVPVTPIRSQTPRRDFNASNTKLANLRKDVIVAFEESAPRRHHRAMTDDEQELLSRCFARDQAGWSEFVQRYAGLIFHTIKRTSAVHGAQRSQDFADDLFQEIFLTLVQDDYFQLRRFRGDHGCTLASWLRMIAARRTIDHLRKSKIPPGLLEEPLEHDPAQALERASDDEQSLVLAKAVEDLPPQEKILIDLFFREGLSAKDVASILRMSIGSVYTQKSRILAKLRERLRKANAL